MTTRTDVIRDLIDRSLYAVDERAVARAIVARAAVREAVPGITLAPVVPTVRGAASPVSDEADEPIRSFRHDPRARPFRLAPRRQRAFH